MASSSNQSAAGANLLGKRKPEDDLETKPILRKHKVTSEEKETTERIADSLQHMRDHPNFISVKEAALGKKTLFISNLSSQTCIADIVDFFKDVVQVVRVRLSLGRNGLHRCYGCVEFASANDAKKALQKKNGEYLQDRQIFLFVHIYLPHPFHRKRHGPMLCIEHKVCHKEYFRRESLPVEEEEDETFPDVVEEVLFVAHISPQTRILHIKDFFKDVGEVVSVRLMVNHEGRHVGYGFVEFASVNEAKKALKKKKSKYLHEHKIFLEVPKTARPPPKYNLAEKLCYEDYLRRQNLLIEEVETVEGRDETPDFVEAVAVREKTVFVDNLSQGTKISDIKDFFKDVGEVVSVRLIVNDKGRHVGYGFVEFASANEAEKALDKKKGEYLHEHKIFLDVAKKAPYPPRPKYCIDHKVWYEDYLGRERLLINEDETVEGLDNIPEYIEEVATRKKTLFAVNLPRRVRRIIEVFNTVLSIRLIVDDRGERVGCGFFEYFSANKAEKALTDPFFRREFCLDVAEMAPYPLRPKYNIAEKLWSNVESPVIKEDDLETEPNLEEQMVPKMTLSKPNYLEEENVQRMDGFCGKKTIFCFGEEEE